MAFRPGQPIQLAPPPDRLPAHPIRVLCLTPPQVKPGDTVKPGQPVSEPLTPDHAPAISPVAGVVHTVIDPTPATPASPHPRGSNHVADKTPCYQVILHPQDQTVATAIAFPLPTERTLEGWLAAFRQMGPWATREGYVGLLAQLRAAQANPPDTLICAGLDSFPPYPVRSSLLMSFPDDAVLGTLILADLFGAKRVKMLTSKQGAVLAKIRPSCRNFRLQLVAHENSYPCGDPTLVVWANTPQRRRLPVGANPVQEVGVALASPWTAIRVARWFTREKFDLVQPMMIGWPQARAAMTHGYALPGQPLASLDPSLQRALAQGDTAILGNPMADPIATPPTPTPQDPDPVVPVPREELLITVMRPVPPPPPEPCISCGWCVEACPTGLRPNRLLERCRRQPDATDLQSQLQWCIDCGLCSHVCPSSLPLARVFHQNRTPPGVKL